MAGEGRRGVLDDVLLVAAKDLRLEARSRVGTNHVLPFVAVVVMLFGIALDADSSTLRRAESGLFWVTMVFAAMLLVQRSAAIERSDGIEDALRLSAMSPIGVYLGKTVALTVQLAVVALVTGLAMVIVYGTTAESWVLVAATTALGVPAVAAAGSIYGPIAMGLAGRETVLSMLLLPVLAPVLLAATRAFEVGLGRGVGSGWPWVGMLGMLVVVYAGLGSITAASIQDET